ncbi:MAG: argininosuccinate lyase [Chloroflexota bacterium]|nr:argininosuccinate lyase [Chloroflexota bacterium]
MKPLRSRFSADIDESVKSYTDSTSYDQRLYSQDIRGSIAHAEMMAKQGIITKKDAEAIVRGLTTIHGEIERGEFQFKGDLEDVHMNIEARLFEHIGDVAGKLHTGRSRNDQVAVDLRLFVKESLENTIGNLRDFQYVLVEVASKHRDIVMPGYTHLQRAQPVLMAHHILAYFEMFERDVSRFRDCLERTNTLPLGSGALAGVPHPLNRDMVARELGFGRISQNSLDAVSDRDFVIEYEAAASITMMHLSRLAEELILWSSAEFGFIEIGDAYTTGSSLMPQKKNPDVAELARGKTGRVYGNLVGTLTMMKGLPLAYNRDMQEDKEPLFDTVDVLHSTLEVFCGMMKTMVFRGDRMRQAADESYLLATDLADYLVRKGVPFRQAYMTVGELVHFGMERGKSLGEISVAEYKNFSPLFDDDVLDISLESAISGRDIVGGTALHQVEFQLKRAKQLLSADGKGTSK